MAKTSKASYKFTGEKIASLDAHPDLLENPLGFKLLAPQQFSSAKDHVRYRRVAAQKMVEKYAAEEKALENVNPAQEKAVRKAQRFCESMGISGAQKDALIKAAAENALVAK